MGIYYAQGTSGQVYPFEIKGLEPSDTEKGRISEYLGNLGDPDQSLIGGDDGGSGIGAAFSGGIDTLQLGFGSAIEGLGESTGVDFLKEYGKEIVETNKQQLSESEQYRTRLDDITGVGSALKFAGQTIVEQVPQLGATIAGGYLGAKTGAAIGTALNPGFGTVIGTGIGTVAGGLAANFPFFYGMNREAQKDEGAVVDEGVAALTAIPQSALDFIADRIVVGAIFNPKFINGGGIFSRAAKGAGAGVATEVPTEIGQQVLERLQAGKELTSEEAIREYRDVAIAAGLIGGSVRGTSNIISGDQNKKEQEEKNRQLDEDMEDLRQDVHGNAALGLKKRNDLAPDDSVRSEVIKQGNRIEEQEEANLKLQEAVNSGASRLSLKRLAPEEQMALRQFRQALGTSQRPFTTTAELREAGLEERADSLQEQQLGVINAKMEDRASVKHKFTQDQYNAAVERVLKDQSATISNIRDAAKTPKGNQPAESVAEAIRDEMIANRVIRKVNDSIYTPLTEQEIASDPTIALKAKLSEEKKKLEANRQAKEAMKERQRALLQSWDGSPAQESSLDITRKEDVRIDRDITVSQKTVKNIQRQIDNIEARTGASGQLANQTFAAEDSMLALRAAQEASKAKPRAEYEARKKDIAKQVEMYAKKDLGLKDFKFSFEDDLSGSRPGTVGQGYYDPRQKLIAIAVGIYDPNMSDAEYISRLKGVVNHEAIHAMRDIRLFTDAEYQSLVKAANERKVAVVRNGESVQRDYTFVDRAMRLNRPRDGEGEAQYKERLNEEAIAEMFRAYVDGRLKVAGKPLSLFKRIINFFLGVKSAHVDAGFDRVDAIFEDIKTGKIGSRSRTDLEGRVESRNKSIDDSLDELKIDAAYSAIDDDEIDEYTALALAERDFSEVGGVKILSDDFLENAQFIRANGQKSTDQNKIMSKLFANRNLDDGTKVSIRPNLNGFIEGNDGRLQMTQTVHQGKNYSTALGYDIFAAVSNPEMLVSPAKRRDIYNGETPKGAKQDKVPMASGSGSYINMSRAEAEGIINNPDHVLSFNPGSKKREVVGHHLFVDEKGYAVEKVDGVAVHFGGKVFVKGKLVYYTTENAPKPLDGLPTSVKYINNSEKDFSEVFTPELPMAVTDKAGYAAHKLPKELLVQGNGQKPTIPVVQSFNPNNKQSVFNNIDRLKAKHPDAMSSAQAFMQMEQDAMGGELLPLPPLNAINYANDPRLMAAKLRQLTPELKDGVDEGFSFVNQIKSLYESGQATPEMTIKMFLWGILSRGAGPVQQESAYIDIVQEATPLVQKAARGVFTEDDISTWENTVKKYLPEGSPGRSVTMNVNSAGKLMFELSKQSPSNEGITVAEELHELLSNPNSTGRDIRRAFLSLTNSAGIDNKVISFVVLVAGKTDVLVMDRIQTGNMWDDGRFGGSNLYDGIFTGLYSGTNGKRINNGFVEVLKGPRGSLITEFMEDGLRPNIQLAYDIVGRPEDASMGRFHWETWVIEGEQVVNHSTLAAIAENNPIGHSVTEGKPFTYSSGMTYRRAPNGAVVEYPLSDDTIVFMTPTRFKEFTKRLSDNGEKDGIYPKGFKVSESTVQPWYTLPEVNRSKLDEIAQQYENARPNGSLRDGSERAGRDTVTIKRGDGRATEPTDGRDFSSVPAVEGLNTLKDFIRNNPDGFTISSSGRPVEGGIVVAPIKSAEIITGQDIPIEVLTEYVENAKSMSRILGKEVFLGGWFNNSDNQYYLDNVLIVEDKVEALYIADAAEQIAIFDLNVFEETRTQDGIKQLQEAGIYRDNIAERYRRGIEQASRLFGRARLSDQEQGKAERAKQSDIIDLSDQEDAFTERLPEDDLRQIQEVQDLLASIGESDQDFMEVPQNPSAPIANPIAVRARNRGETVANPFLFGIIEERGRKYPVTLFAGQDVESQQDNLPIPNMGSFGLYHIHKRNHDKELTENSKFPSVEDAIYATLRQWDRQGRTDGEVIAIPDGGASNMDLRMEWKKPSHKSPPLVMSLKFIPNKGRPMYTVRTMYPELDAKQKKAMQSDFMSVPLAAETVRLSQQVNENANQIMYSKSYEVLKNILRMKGLVSDQKAESITKEFLMKFQDRMLPVGEIIDKLRSEGANITDALDTYQKETLYHGITGERINTATDSLYKPLAEITRNIDVENRFNELESSSDFVKQSLDVTGSKKVAAVEAYLYALHAKERNEYIRSIDPSNDSGSGMTDSEADRIIAWEGSLAPEQRAVFAEVRSKVRDIISDTNKIRRDSGLIPVNFETDKAAIDEEGTEFRLPPVYSDYIPLRGILDPLGEANEDGSFAGTGGASYSVRGKEDRASLGRDKYPTNLLAGVFMQNQNSIVRSEKNAVAKSFLDLIRSDPERMSEYAIELKTMPMRRGIVNGTVRVIPDFNALKDPSILVVKEAGEFTYIRLNDARIARALNGSIGVNPQTSNAIIRGAGLINRYLSNINTSFNPEFIVTNMFRDIQTAGVNVNQYERKGLTAEVMKNFKSAFKGVRDVVREKGSKPTITKEIAEQPNFDINNISNEDLFRLFQIYGGQNATNQMSDLADQVNNVKKLVGDIAESGARGQWNKVKNSFIGEKTWSMLKFLEDYNTVVENAIRVATFKTLAPKIGLQKAAFAARNVTVDFAKGGEYKTAMNAMYLFYNASIQGSFALLNAATRSAKVRKMWAGLVVFGILQDQLNAAISDEDDDGKLIYDKTPKYILEHNIILPDPFGVTDRSEIAIPMPYGLNMAVNFGRSLSRFSRGQYSIGEAGNSIIGTAVDTLNPLGGTHSFLNFVMPTVVDPFIDIARNKDFADKPITKETSPFDPTPPPNSQLYWSTTSPSAKWVAENLNRLTGGSAIQSGILDVSPDLMEYWIGFLTGGAGMFAQRTADLAFGTLPTALTEGFEDEMVRQVPFARKLFYSVSSREDLSAFIENRNKVLQSQELLKSALESGDMAQARSIRQRYEKELRISGQVKAMNSARNRILRQMKQIKDNPRLPEEQKNKMIEKLGDQLDVVMTRANKLMNANL
jgi:uncharacterized membrane protein